MRYPVGCTLVLVALMAWSQRVSAQADEEAETSEPSLQQPAPSSEAADDEGGLSPGLRKRTRKKWDPGTYDVQPPGTEFALIPSQPPKRGLNARQRAGIGLGVSIIAFGAGIGMGMAALGGAICINFGEPEPCSRPNWVAPVGITGALLSVGGVIGMAVSGTELRHSKHDQDSMRATPHRTPHRAHWDLARSRLVF